MVRRKWILFDYRCGKWHAVFVRKNLGILATNEPLEIWGEIRGLLDGIRPAPIDRILKPERGKLEPKGHSRTHPEALLKHHIPIRPEKSEKLS